MNEPYNFVGEAAESQGYRFVSRRADTYGDIVASTGDEDAGSDSGAVRRIRGSGDDQTQVELRAPEQHCQCPRVVHVATNVSIKYNWYRHMSSLPIPSLPSLPVF
jgi:hypothetical protein